MNAKSEMRETDLYAMDLVWMIARHFWDIQTPQPTKRELDHAMPDTRSAQQIQDDMLKKAQELAQRS